MNSRLPISVVILTCNEAGRIENCVSHARLLTDDVIVVDSGSADNTVDIVSGLGCRVLLEGKAVNLPQPLIKVRLNPRSITIDEKWRHKKFIKIKQRALKNGDIDQAEGNKLLSILNLQDTPRIKEGAYYSLLAKKFLWNNYQPGKARSNLKQALALNPLEWRSYGLYLLSYLPESLLLRLYQLIK